VDADGTLYVTAGIANELLAVDPLTGDATLESAQGSFTALQDVAIEVDGLVLVLDLDGEVIRVDPDAFDSGNPGTNQQILSTGMNLVAPSALAVTELNSVLVGDPDAQAGAGAVIEVDEVDGDQSVLAAGDAGASPPFTRPAGVAIGRRSPVAGQVFVADLNGELVRADPATGEQAMVSRRGFFTGNKAVAIEADGRVLVVSSGFAEPGRVVRVDPVTGRQQVLSLGGDFNLPESIALAPDGTIFVGDSAAAPFPPSEAGAIFAIDPETGAQTIVATGGALNDSRDVALVPEPPIRAGAAAALLALAALARRVRRA